MTSPAPHVCDYRDPDGTTAGGCHLLPPHGGRCPDCEVTLGGGRTTHADALDCRHQSSWELELLCPVDACVAHATGRTATSPPPAEPAGYRSPLRALGHAGPHLPARVRRSDLVPLADVLARHRDDPAYRAAEAEGVARADLLGRLDRLRAALDVLLDDARGAGWTVPAWLHDGLHDRLIELAAQLEEGP